MDLSTTGGGAALMVGCAACVCGALYYHGACSSGATSTAASHPSSSSELRAPPHGTDAAAAKKKKKKKKKKKIQHQQHNQQQRRRLQQQQRREKAAAPATKSAALRTPHGAKKSHAAPIKIKRDGEDSGGAWHVQRSRNARGAAVAKKGATPAKAPEKIPDSGVGKPNRKNNDNGNNKSSSTGNSAKNGKQKNQKIKVSAVRQPAPKAVVKNDLAAILSAGSAGVPAAAVVAEVAAAAAAAAEHNELAEVRSRAGSVTTLGTNAAGLLESLGVKVVSGGRTSRSGSRPASPSLPSPRTTIEKQIIMSATKGALRSESTRTASSDESEASLASSQDSQGWTLVPQKQTAAKSEKNLPSKREKTKKKKKKKRKGNTNTLPSRSVLGTA